MTVRAPTDADGKLACFERERPALLGLAYRMLGLRPDAEDVVQEAWLRWETHAGTVTNPPGWLRTTTAHLALDRLRALKRRREDYVGPWLPEPLVGTGPVAVDPGPGPEDSLELAESLTLGFLTLLDRLSPNERAVFLLADVFAVGYPEIAASLGRSEAACRQLASRARRKLRRDGPSSAARMDAQVIERLLVAVALGDVAGALSSLAPDVVLVTDGGPNRRAARRPVVGADRVARLLINLAHRQEPPFEVELVTVNGRPGVALTAGGELDSVVAVDTDDARVRRIWLVRSPEKLARVRQPLSIS